MYRGNTIAPTDMQLSDIPTKQLNLIYSSGNRIAVYVICNIQQYILVVEEMMGYDSKKGISALLLYFVNATKINKMIAKEQI